jgi:hypothetical protein
MPCRMCGWKCILLQWIVSSIFLKLKYPGKHNTINSLRAAILCKGSDPLQGRYLTPVCEAGEPTNPRNPRVCHEADRPTYQAL